MHCRSRRTAAAVASIAYGEPVPAIDGNAKRVLARLFDVSMPEGTRMQLQDRAYTSPIWYTP